MEVDDSLEATSEVPDDRKKQIHQKQAAINGQSSHIFDLNNNCFMELLDWLSLQELHAFGETCKLLQGIAGCAFQKTYCAVFAECKSDGIYIDSIRVNGFCSSVSCLSFQTDHIKSFEFAASKDFKCVNRILLNAISLSDAKIDCLKKLLKKVEIVELIRCTIDGDIYNKLLKRCKNMKRLCVNVNEPVGTVIGVDNKWLLRKYSKLEYFELSGIGKGTHLNELTTFFQLNKNIQKFATNDQCLLMKWAKNADLKITDLAIQCDVHEYDRPKTFQRTLKRLRKLNKYVQLYVDHAYQSTLNKISSKKRIEKFHAQSLSVIRFDRVFFFPLGNLVELCIPFVLNDINLDTMAKKLTNLQQLLVDSAGPELIMAFVSHSVKLERMGVRSLEYGFQHEVNCHLVDVSIWSKERAKLKAAGKTSLHVHEKVFLATKWAGNTVDCELVELKRLESFDWNHDFGFV